MRAQHLIFVLAAAMLTACGVEEIVHDLDEREANRIIELLDDNGVSSSKTMKDTGRSVTFQINVPKGSRLEAIRVLNLNEMPRRRDMGYNEIFKEGGLIPTAAEEKAKKLASIEGEIERQLKLIDGILDVQVQLVVPDETALRTTQEQVPPTTASVTIKYLPGAGGTKPLSEPQIQAIVAGGVEKLTADNVVVVMTPGSKQLEKAAVAAAAGGILGKRVGLGRLTDKQLHTLTAAVIFLVLLLSLGIIFAQMRLKTVRGRLVRLQTEIAKARRKPGETLPPAAS